MKDLMKRRILFFSGVLAMCLAGFSSCSSDDSPQPEPSVPRFTVKAAGVTVSSQGENLTRISAPAEAADIVLSVVSSHASELKSTSVLPEGWSITAGEPVNVADNQVTQEFVVRISDNGPSELSHEFVLTNKQDAAKQCKLLLVQQAGRPMLPLEYVAEYNLEKDGKTFLKTHDNAENSKHLFTWDEVQNISVEGHHVPTVRELAGIVPMGGVIQFGAPLEDGLDKSDEVEVGGVTLTCLGDYLSYGEGGVAYGIRFKDNAGNLRSAWKYEYVKNPEGDGKVLKITCRYLGEAGAGLALEKLAEEGYWTTNAEKDVVRHIPAAGQISYGRLGYVNKEGHLWSVSPYESSYAYGMMFSDRNAQTCDVWNRSYGQSLRLFLDATKK